MTNGWKEQKEKKMMLVSVVLSVMVLVTIYHCTNMQGVLLSISAAFPSMRKKPSLLNRCLLVSSGSMPVWLTSCLANLDTVVTE